MHSEYGRTDWIYIYKQRLKHTPFWKFRTKSRIRKALKQVN